MSESPNVMGEALGQRALERRWVTQAQLDEALALQAKEAASATEPRHLGLILMDRGYISGEQLFQLLVQQDAGRTESDRRLSSGVFSAAEGGPGLSALRTFGRYILTRKLGLGAMGVVYEALDPTLKRKVALKMLRTSSDMDPKDLELDARWFLREAQMAAGLPKHPHIVGIYEAGVTEDRRYMAMEYVDGRQMQQWARETGATLRRQVALLRDVALAVQHAHEHGIIHRDLKPKNVLVDAKNQPHVTDFGLAKSIRPDAGASLTEKGYAVGTPDYMSPEQAQGSSVDARTDIYSMGVMLYEVLTGKPPFEGESAVQLLVKVVSSPIRRPTTVRQLAGVDPAIENICMRALAKKPTERYLTARALADDLAKWLGGEPVKVTPPNERPRRPVLAVAAAALSIVAIGLWMIRALSGPADPPQVPSVRTPPAGPAPAAMEKPRGFPAAPGTPEYAEAWKKAVPILSWVDPGRDAVQGAWTIREGKLVSDASKFAKIEIPYRPPSEYDLRVTFTREQGEWDVACLISKDGRATRWAMGAYQNRIFGFGSIDGKDIIDNPSTVRSESCLENGRVYTALVQVRADGVAAYLDGVLVSRHKTDYADMGTSSIWKLRDDGLLGLGSHESVTVFHAIDLLEVSGKGARSRPDLASAVLVPTRASLAIDLGRADGVEGIALVDRPDGRFDRLTFEGQSCVRMRRQGNEPAALYLDVEDLWAQGVGIAALDVEHWDGEAAGNTFGVEFDASGKGVVGKRAGVVRLGGRKDWVTSRVVLANPNFSNQRGGVADIKLNASSGDVYFRRVTVSSIGTRDLPLAAPFYALKVVAADAARLKPGLAGHYYSGRHFDARGPFQAAATVAFDWGIKAAWSGGPADKFSVRWKGYVKVPEAGDYLLDVRGDNGIRVFLDGAPVVASWHASLRASLVQACTLEAGLHRLEVDYFDDTQSASVFVEFLGRGDGRYAPLGPESFFHLPEDEAVEETPFTTLWKAVLEGKKALVGRTVPIRKAGAAASVNLPLKDVREDGWLVEVKEGDKTTDVLERPEAVTSSSFVTLVRRAVPNASLELRRAIAAFYAERGDLARARSELERLGKDAAPVLPAVARVDAAEAVERSPDAEGREAALRQVAKDYAENPGVHLRSYLEAMGFLEKPAPPPRAAVSIELGKPDGADGVRIPAAADGRYEIVSHLDRPCMKLAHDPQNTGRVVFDLDDAWARGVVMAEVEIEHSGAEGASGYLMLMYDSMESAYGRAGLVTSGPVKGWKTTTVILPSPRFENRLAKAGDLQVQAVFGTHHVSRVTVRGIRPEQLPPAVHAPLKAASVEVAALRPGLVGRYYGGESFEWPRPPRIEPRVSFDWIMDSPGGVPADHFSARWSGYVKIEAASKGVVEVQGDNGARIFVDGLPVAQSWKGVDRLALGPCEFEAGFHRIEVEYREEALAASVRAGVLVERKGRMVALGPEHYFHDPAEAGPEVSAFEAMWKLVRAGRDAVIGQTVTSQRVGSPSVQGALKEVGETSVSIVPAGKAEAVEVPAETLMSASLQLAFSRAVPRPSDAQRRLAALAYAQRGDLGRAYAQLDAVAAKDGAHGEAVARVVLLDLANVEELAKGPMLSGLKRILHARGPMLAEPLRTHLEARIKALE